MILRLLEPHRKDVSDEPPALNTVDPGFSSSIAPEDDALVVAFRWFFHPSPLIAVRNI